MSTQTINDPATRKPTQYIIGRQAATGQYIIWRRARGKLRRVFGTADFQVFQAFIKQLSKGET